MSISATANLTLNGTVNPDFSQVESDAGQFSFDPRLALFFPEKRPFFNEGSGLFTTPETLLFTRRIVDPSAGARMTAKSGSWVFAGLAARDRQAMALANGPRDGTLMVGRVREVIENVRTILEADVVLDNAFANQPACFATTITHEITGVYGAGKVGGLVNFIPKSARDEGRFLAEPEGQVTATFGSYNKKLVTGQFGALGLNMGAGLLDADGRALDGKKPSAETLLHCLIYRIDPQAGAVLHTHNANAHYHAVLAATGNTSGVPFHVLSAKAHGASREEVLSAVLIGLPAAGAVVIGGVQVALEAFDGQEDSPAP